MKLEQRPWPYPKDATCTCGAAVSFGTMYLRNPGIPGEWACSDRCFNLLFPYYGMQATSQPTAVATLGGFGYLGRVNAKKTQPTLVVAESVKAFTCHACNTKYNPGDLFVHPEGQHGQPKEWACSTLCFEGLYTHYDWGNASAAKFEAMIRAQRKKRGVCLECGDPGEWRMLALFCCKCKTRICG